MIRNKSIQTFLFESDNLGWKHNIPSIKICVKLVEQLLRDKHTIQGLKIDIFDILSLDIVNTLITALEIRLPWCYDQQTSLFP